MVQNSFNSEYKNCMELLHVNKISSPSLVIDLLVILAFLFGPEREKGVKGGKKSLVIGLHKQHATIPFELLYYNL